MDMKTAKWYVSARLGESQHTLNGAPVSLRAAMNLTGSLLQLESGQFTRNEEDILIRFSLRPIDAVKPGLLDSDPRFTAVETDINPLSGESSEDYVQRLTDMEIPETLIQWSLFEYFGITSDQYETTRKWQADTDIRRLIRATASGEEFERMGVPEYRRLQEYALTQYPTMCQDIQWRVAL